MRFRIVKPMKTFAWFVITPEKIEKIENIYFFVA